MKVFNNELVIHRNETFTIDKYLVNKDGSPYLISNQIPNPYFLLTVTSSKYEQTDRYTLNKWLSLANTPRFKSTVFENIADHQTELWDGTWANAVLPAGYEGNSSVYANEAAFYLQDDAGNRTYKYWVYSGVDYAGAWTDYNLRLTTSFLQDITRNWIEQTYYYGILLVGGPAAETGSDVPIASYDLVYTILEPTKLTVLSNLKGGM